MSRQILARDPCPSGLSENRTDSSSDMEYLPPPKVKITKILHTHTHTYISIYVDTFISYLLLYRERESPKVLIILVPGPSARNPNKGHLGDLILKIVPKAAWVAKLIGAVI